MDALHKLAIYQVLFPKLSLRRQDLIKIMKEAPEAYVSLITEVSQVYEANRTKEGQHGTNTT